MQINHYESCGRCHCHPCVCVNEAQKRADCVDAVKRNIAEHGLDSFFNGDLKHILLAVDDLRDAKLDLLKALDEIVGVAELSIDAARGRGSSGASRVRSIALGAIHRGQFDAAYRLTPTTVSLEEIRREIMAIFERRESATPIKDEEVPHDGEVHWIDGNAVKAARARDRGDVDWKKTAKNLQSSVEILKRERDEARGLQRYQEDAIGAWKRDAAGKADEITRLRAEITTAVKNVNDEVRARHIATDEANQSKEQLRAVFGAAARLILGAQEIGPGGAITIGRDELDALKKLVSG